MMSGLVRVLQSDVILQTALVTLRRATDSRQESRKYVTERQVHKVLFLLALGLQESKVETEHSRFLAAARDCGVFPLVSRLGTAFPTECYATDEGEAVCPCDPQGY